MSPRRLRFAALMALILLAPAAAADGVGDASALLQQGPAKALPHAPCSTCRRGRLLALLWRIWFLALLGDACLVALLSAIAALRSGSAGRSPGAEGLLRRPKAESHG
mmetsp:Transcript_86017/g.244010  ORF Transcript_86017/g.244010 Transcript_86017/m.244010 type:complete len:107 (+) Transcript_86017:59-379(+)